MQIKPLSDHILIEPIREEEKTKTGIILPETAEKEKPEQGQVVAVGEKCKEVKPGDKVIFRKYDPDPIKVEDKEYLIAKEEQILAILQ